MYATILAQEISIYVPFIKPCKGVCRTPENRIAPLVSGAVLCMLNAAKSPEPHSGTVQCHAKTSVVSYMASRQTVLCRSNNIYFFV